MKRAFEPDEDEGTGDENKKVKFPVLTADKYKPLPEPLATRLKENPNLYLSVNSDEKWNWDDVFQNAMKEMELDFSNIEKDDLDELIDADEKASMSLPPSLLQLYKDIIKTQQKTLQAHVEQGDFRDDSSAELLTSLEKEQAEKDVKFYITEDDLNRGLRKVDYSVPFVFHLGQCFREFATSKGQQLNTKMDESENPLTLKMLKRNPEGHGLDKTVVERFSDDHEIVDVQLNLGGKKKTLRAFKDRRNILIPCKEKNCQHTGLDINNVSICPNSEECAGNDPKDDEEEYWEPGSPPEPEFAPSWDVDISNDDVIICETKSADKTTASSPQITSVQSLAPIVDVSPTRLIPLASQLPNPVKKRSRAAPRLLPPLQGIPFSPNLPSRPSILSKTGQSHAVSIPGNIPGTILLLQQPINTNIMRRSGNSGLPILRPITSLTALTASQLPRLKPKPMGTPVAPKVAPSTLVRMPTLSSGLPEDIGMSIIAASSASDTSSISTSENAEKVDEKTKVVEKVVNAANSQKSVNSASTSDKVVNPASTSQEVVNPVSTSDKAVSSASRNEKVENSKDSPVDEVTNGMKNEGKTDYEGKTEDGTSNAPTLAPENGATASQDSGSTDTSESESDDTEDITQPRPTPFNFAKNIFEDNEDEEMDDEEPEPEPEDSSVNDFSVPQIVSTAGGVEMFAPETILVTPELDPENVTIESPAITRAKAAKQRLIRAKADSVAIMGDLKFKLEHPKQKSTGTTCVVICPLCEEEFGHDSLSAYRAHLNIDHKIVMKSLAEPNSRKITVATGRVGRVEVIPPELVRGGESVKQESAVKPLVVREFHRCKACDQLLQRKDTSEHRLACCPNQRADFAFTVVKITTDKSEMPLVCGLCEKSCDSAVGLRQHLTLSHREIAFKIILEPDMRCGKCLTKFEDSVHLTLHCQRCTTRRASRETMLELAQGTLYCEICLKAHNTINATQDCYTNATMIRCLICLNVVLSRGNFFHHMKVYHDRGSVGICCPFCDMPEIPIRDCFIHIIDNHYNPILQLQKRRGSGGYLFDGNRILMPPLVKKGSKGGSSRQFINVVGSNPTAASSNPTASSLVRAGQSTASNLVIAGQGTPVMLQAQPVAGSATKMSTATTHSNASAVRFANTVTPTTSQPQYMALQTINPVQLSSGALKPVTPAMLGSQQKQGQTLRFKTSQGAYRTIHLRPASPGMTSLVTGNAQTGFRPIQLPGGLRYIAPAPTQNVRQNKSPATASAQVVGATSPVRTIRIPTSTETTTGNNLRPQIISVRGGATNAVVTAANSSGTLVRIPGTVTPVLTAGTALRPGTFQPITLAQLQRARSTLTAAPRQIAPAPVVNVSSLTNLNLQKQK